ncbi:hypothetical protein PGB90_008177 [Kerria lacca]
MESFKILISIAFVVVCSLAVQAVKAEETPVEQAAPAVAIVSEQPVHTIIPEGSTRTKKQAVLPLGYSAYPYAAYPYYNNYPYAYSYSYYDDGKYWPGKYEKVVPYRTYPYSYYPYNYYY